MKIKLMQIIIEIWLSIKVIAYYQSWKEMCVNWIVDSDRVIWGNMDLLSIWGVWIEVIFNLSI